MIAKAQATNEKLAESDFRMKNICASGTNENAKRKISLNWIKILISNYIKNTYNSIIKRKTTQLKVDKRLN